MSLTEALSPQRTTAAHVYAEWRDKRDLLHRAALEGQSAVSALVAVAKACIWTGEADEVRATARDLAGGLIDGLKDALVPFHRRARDADLDPIDFALDLSELEALHKSLATGGRAA